MSIPTGYIDVTGRSSSTHHNGIQNDVPFLSTSNAHPSDPVNHDGHSEKGQEGEVIYSSSMTSEKGAIPHLELQGDLHRKRHGETSKEPVAANDREQSTTRPSHSDEEPQSHAFTRNYKRYRLLFHTFLWVVFTGWWIAGLILHGVHDPLSSNTAWLKPFLLWLTITFRLIFFQVPISILTKPIRRAWGATGVRLAELLPDRLKIPLAALLVVSVFMIGGFASPESEDNTRDNRAVSLFGLAVFISVLYATSRNRKAVNWHTVIVGMLVCII